MTGDILTFPEVAQALGITVRAVQYRVRAGRLQTIYLGSNHQNGRPVRGVPVAELAGQIPARRRAINRNNRNAATLSVEAELLATLRRNDLEALTKAQVTLMLARSLAVLRRPAPRTEEQ